MQNTKWKVVLVSVVLGVDFNKCDTDFEHVDELKYIHPFLEVSDDSVRGEFVCTASRKMELTPRSISEMERMKEIWVRYLGCAMEDIQISEPVVAEKMKMNTIF